MRKSSEPDWERLALTQTPRSASASTPDDVARSRFPFCIVWTPIPVITWLLPFVGHMGIADSRGVIYDFAGPYSIGVDDLAFGLPAKILRLRPELAARGASGASPAQAFDAAVDAGCDVYQGRIHNLCCDNCHSHVARALNEMRYDGRSDWNMVLLAALLFFWGEFVTPMRAVGIYLPFLIGVAVILALRFGLAAQS